MHSLNHYTHSSKQLPVETRNEAQGIREDIFNRVCAKVTVLVSGRGFFL